MKIRFKLNANQLKVWIACLELFWMEPATDSPAVIRMVYHALSKLLHRLRSEELLRKPTYSFSIDGVEGLAFIAHIQSYSQYILAPEDVVVINQIIGIIDLKTKEYVKN